MPGLLIAQAIVEHGLLSSLADGFVRLCDEIDTFVGYRNSSYLLGGAVVLLLFLLLRRRR